MSRAEGTAGKGVRFESYAGLGHGSSPQEIEHLKAWCVSALAPTSLLRTSASRESAC